MANARQLQSVLVSGGTGNAQLGTTVRRKAACGERSEHFWVPGAFVLGIIVGLIVPLFGDQSVGDSPGERVSSVLGWTYFCMWSCSFYPQIVRNFRERSVVGLSIEYQLLNFVAFGCYFIFNAALFWDPTVQKEYEDANHGSKSAVKLNDVFFSAHAMALTGVTLVQICIYYDYGEVDRSDKILGYFVWAALSAVVVAAVVLAVLASVSAEQTLDWLSYIYVLSYVKVVISVCKYCPQVRMNYKRQSTVGWSIHNVLLDWSGGSLSVAQLCLDAWQSHDWSQVTGDPAKFLLGNVSMFFDIIFMVQHYCFYPRKKRPGA